MEEKTLNTAIMEYKEIKEKLQRIPLKKDLSTSSQTIIIKKYGLYRYFLQSMDDYKVGVIKHCDRGISTIQLISEIQDLYHRLGYPPKENQYEHSRTAARRLGGSWRDALKSCHINATFVGNSIISKQEVIYKGRKEIEKYHRMPTWKEMYKDHFPANQIMKYWKGIDDFAKEFDLQTERENRKKKVEKDIILAAQKLIKERKTISFKNVVAASNDKSLTISRINNFLINQSNQKVINRPSLTEFLDKKGIKIDSTKSHQIVIAGKKYSSWLEAEQKTGIKIGTLQNEVQLKS